MRPPFPLSLLALFVVLGSTASAGPPQSSEQPHLVMLVAEREYQTEASLRAFTKQHLADRYRVTMLTAAEDDPNRIPGIEAINDADLLIVSVRRRALPESQLAVVRNYVSAGKPVIGIRTASHAFSLRNQDPPRGRAVWPQWDRQVFGGNYTNHYGNALAVTVTLEPARAADPVLVRDLDGTSFTAGGSLYRVSPLAERAQPFLFGEVQGQAREPVAWTFIGDDGGKSFYTSLGHVADFDGQVLPQLLLNAIEWALE